MSQIKFNFISIPRCASRSIHAALSTSGGNFKNHHSIKTFENPDLPTFAVFREPIDHIRSWYSFHRNRFGNEVRSFYNPDMVKWAEEGFPTHWSEGACKQCGVTNPISQWDYISMDGKIKVEDLIDFAQLEKGLNHIAQKFGIKLNYLHCKGRAPKFNVPKEIIPLANEMFPMDFEVYKKVKNE